MQSGYTVRDAWGKWLNYNWKWEWFVSLTFRDSHVGTVRANNLWRKWYGDLVKSTGNDVGFFRVTEWQRYRGIPHYHALMLNLDGVRRLKWLDRWVDIAGWARVLPYNPKKGANYYLSKYVTKEMGEVLFSDNIQEYTRFSPKQLKFEKKPFQSGRNLV